MERHLDQELTDLKTKIVAMGAKVETAVEEAVGALLNREVSRLNKVFEVEESINLSHVEVDEWCLNLLARQSPMASDLRLILAIVKINTDLERMGDQAVNISYNSRDYLSRTTAEVPSDFGQMCQDVRAMIRDSLDAFINKDFQLAHRVLKRDDIVDSFKNTIFQKVIALMTQDSGFIRQGMDLILIARNLERLADHATNIAEDVIFAVTGEDVRHQGLHQRQLDEQHEWDHDDE